MDAERIARLFRDGQITGPQILRAAALGLIAPEDVPPEAGDADAEIANLALLKQRADGAAIVNRQLESQVQPIIDFCKAVSADGTPADQVPLPNLVNAVRVLASAIQTLAEHDREALSQRTNLARIATGDYTHTD